MESCRKCSAVRRHPLLLHSEAAPSCRRKNVQGPFGRPPAVRPRERIEKSRLMFLHPPKVFFSKVTTQLLLRKKHLRNFAVSVAKFFPLLYQAKTCPSGSPNQGPPKRWMRANIRTELVATSNPRATGTRRKTWNLTNHETFSPLQRVQFLQIVHFVLLRS